MTIYDRDEPIESNQDEPREPEADASTEANEDAAVGEAPPPEAEPEYRSTPEQTPEADETPEAAAVDSTNAGANALTLKLLAVPLLVIVCAPALFLGLGRSTLWEPDEPRLAEASRQMVASGDYLTPYLDGLPRFDPPVLTYWLQALTFQRLGISEYAARMPAALAGLGCVLLIYLIGMRLFTARAALLGAIILATTFGFVVQSRSGLTDVPLLFFTLLGLYGFIRAVDAPPPGGRFALLAWLAIALGVLTKGPAGLLPLIIWIPYLLLSGRWGGLRRMRFSSGALIALVIAAPWYLYMAWTHGRAFVELALLSEVMRGYTSPDVTGPMRDPMADLRVWPMHALPWTIYFVGAVASAVGWRTIASDGRRGVAFCLIWFLVGVGFVWFPEYEISQTLLPIYPAAALLIGLLFDRALSDPDGARPWFALSSWLTALGLLVLAGVVGLSLQRSFGTLLLSWGMMIPVALALGGVFLAIFQRTDRPMWVFGTVVPVAAFAYAFFAVHTIPRELEPYKPVLIAAQPETDRQIGQFRTDHPGLAFYARQHVERLRTADQVTAFLSEDGLRLCVMPDAALESVLAGYSGSTLYITRHRVTDLRLTHLLQDLHANEQSTLIVLSNRPPPGATN